MKAENRLLPEWFDHIRSGRIRLPRFQRYEVWGQGEITGLLETVVRGLPAGATLVLEVKGEEKFASRPISGTPDPTERCREHLLDGQQRLTALWKCLYGLYEDRSYFVYFKADEDHDGRDVPQIYGQARWWKDGIQHPVWCDKPQEVFKRRYLPVHLMRPDENAFKQIRKWCDRATDGNTKASRNLEENLLAVRDLFTQFNLPYLSLPASTPADVALDVFIKLNTVSVKLSTFDVIVAKFEHTTGQSLRQLTTDLTNEVPQVERYTEPEELILSVATMREGYAPTQANYQKIDLQGLLQEWPELVAGVKWAIEFLEAESIFDGERLPTTVVLPVLAALHDDLPKSDAKRQEAIALIRKYLWRAFLTRRYENSVSNRSLQDLRGLRDVVAGHDRGVPIFDENEFPLPTVEELMLIDWPKRRDTLARGVLAVALKAGAQDLIDGEPASIGHVRQRDYLHLFPFALLTGDGQMPGSETYRALNCALLGWESNRILSCGEPANYFRLGAQRSHIGAQVIRDRLATHLIPVEQLSVGGYAKIGDEDDRAEKVRVDYQAFLKARAELMMEPMHALCEGLNWPEESLPEPKKAKAAAG
jgi:hypothetical protein